MSFRLWNFELVLQIHHLTWKLRKWFNKSLVNSVGIQGKSEQHTVGQLQKQRGSINIQTWEERKVSMWARNEDIVLNRQRWGYNVPNNFLWDKLILAWQNAIKYKHHEVRYEWWNYKNMDWDAVWEVEIHKGNRYNKVKKENKH